MKRHLPGRHHWGMEKNRIENLIVDIKKYEETLKSVLPSSFSAYEKADVKTKSTVERHLQLISDLEQNVLIALYKGLFEFFPTDIKDVFAKLSEKLRGTVIEEVKRRKLFRNKLIHAYIAGLYDRESFEQAKNLSDVDSFIDAIKKAIR